MENDEKEVKLEEIFTDSEDTPKPEDKTENTENAEKTESAAEKPKLTPKKLIKRFWILIPAVLALLMLLILPLMPEFTEYVVSRGLFKVFTVPVGFITSLIPISLTELAVVLALPAVVIIIILIARKIRKNPEKKRAVLVKTGRTACGFLSFSLFLYMLCHGANFYRLPIEKTLNLHVVEVTPEYLVFTCEKLIEGAKEASKDLPLDENGCTKLPRNLLSEMTRAADGYEVLCDRYPFLWTSVFRQKPVLLSEAWSYTGITGMYFPFFVECNVNTAQPDYLIPAAAAHESAHARGIAFENDCNFLSFLSCVSSDYPEFRYAGYMMALTYCSNTLYDYDQELWQNTDKLLSDRMRADFSKNNEYIRSHRGSRDENGKPTDIIGEIHDFSGAVNDAFISSQGVEDGAMSYGRVVELVVAYYCG